MTSASRSSLSVIVLRISNLSLPQVSCITGIHLSYPSGKFSANRVGELNKAIKIAKMRNMCGVSLRMVVLELASGITD
jgi:hypothetical protein